MHILSMILVGLVAGALAKLLMPGKDPGGIIVTILLGIAGSFVAGLLGRALHLYHSVSDARGIIASTIGAFILLLIYRLATGRGMSRTPPPRRV
jgi:uncharacterized membrane protein YeaQ/YmgE (transglycosylase-associated protein family)